MLSGRPYPHAITADRPDKGNGAELIQWLAAIVRGAPSLMRVLLTMRALDLPDWVVMSGVVYQRVLNALTKRLIGFRRMNVNCSPTGTWESATSCP